MDESAPSRALKLLANLNTFSHLVLQLPLRPYQLQPARAILQSILHRRGLEFLLVFPRQSGKNEAVAQLLVYLLNLYHRAGGNIIYAATGDALGLGIQRLEARLDNPLNRSHWRTLTKPRRRRRRRPLGYRPGRQARQSHRVLETNRIPSAGSPQLRSGQAGQARAGSSSLLSRCVMQAPGICTCPRSGTVIQSNWLCKEPRHLRVHRGFPD